MNMPRRKTSNAMEYGHRKCDGGFDMKIARGKLLFKHSELTLLHLCGFVSLLLVVCARLQSRSHINI